MQKELPGCVVSHPAGASSISLGGETYEADGKGNIEIPHEYLGVAQQHGFLLNDARSAKPVVVEAVGHDHDKPDTADKDVVKSTASTEQVKKLSDLSKADLLATGSERGLPVKSKMTKEELIAVFELFDKPLEDCTRDELLVIAEHYELDVKSSATKDEIIEAIQSKET